MAGELWYPLFVALGLGYLSLLRFAKERKRQLAYLIAGSLFGFYFDVVSVSQGYYVYANYFPMIAGVPLTVTIAEGFSTAITIYLYTLLARGTLAARIRDRLF